MKKILLAIIGIVLVFSWSTAHFNDNSSKASRKRFNFHFSSQSNSRDNSFPVKAISDDVRNLNYIRWVIDFDKIKETKRSQSYPSDSNRKHSSNPRKSQ